MAVAKQFKQLSEIHQGNTAATNLKMLDHIPMQHEDTSSSTNNLGRLRFAQLMCTPFATAGNHSSGTYSATVSNYPDFSIKYQDVNGNDHYLVGMKVRVKFNNGITYGSVSGGTYPLLNICGTSALPLLAQGMPMASGAATSGQTLEFTLIPYGNNYAWDADSNVRESTSDYTIYTDGSITYSKNKADNTFQPKGSYCTKVYFGIVEYPIDITLQENANYILIDGYNIETYFAIISCGWGGEVAFQAIGNIDSQLIVTRSRYTLHLQPTGVHSVGVAKIAFA